MRSWLIVPARDADLEAALASDADALVVDLGDPSLAERDATRARVAQLLESARGGSRPALFVQIAPLGSAAIAADLASVVAAGARGVVLQRACGGASVQQLAAKLAVAEAECGRDDGATRIVALATQTPAAVFALGAYAGASPRLTALAFDVEPLRRALGATLDAASFREAASPFAMTRAALPLAAAAAGAAAIDRPFPMVGDEAGLRAECLAGRRDGFSGKLAVSPLQIRVINETFEKGARSL